VGIAQIVEVKQARDRRISGKTLPRRGFGGTTNALMPDMNLATGGSRHGKSGSTLA
jgi:hypothetical protein